MKKAAMVLGIIGGSLALLAGLYYILSFVLIWSAVPGGPETLPQTSPTPGGIPGVPLLSGASYPILLILCFFILSLVGGGLGLTGGILAMKRSMLAGIFMLISAILSFVFCVTFILLALGGIFALVKGKSNPAPAVP